MRISTKLLSILYLSTFFFNFSSQSKCGGFELKLKYLKNCGNQQQPMMILPNNSISFGDCTIMPNVCTQIQAFKTAQLNITVYKNGISIFQGHHNICNKKKVQRNMAIKFAMTFFGIPNICPYEQSTFCSDEKNLLNMTASTRLFDTLVGPIKCEATVETDLGKSCFVVEADFVKKI